MILIFGEKEKKMNIANGKHSISLPLLPLIPKILKIFVNCLGFFGGGKEGWFQVSQSQFFSGEDSGSNWER